MKRVLSVILALAFTVGCASVSAFAEVETASDFSSTLDPSSEVEVDLNYTEYSDYAAYIEQHSNELAATQEFKVLASAVTKKTDGVELRDGSDSKYTYKNGNFDKVVYTTDTDSVEFTFTLPKGAAGMYNLKFTYFNEPGKDAAMTRSLSINGEIPFDSAQNLSFNRVWVDDLKTNSEGIAEFDKDVYGNEIRPAQKEIYQWNDEYLYDYMGYETEPLRFFFKDGVNTISLQSKAETMTIGQIQLLPLSVTPSYAEYKAANSDTASYSGDELIMQAEYTYQKSDKTLYPTADVSTVSTSVRDGKTTATLQLINEIGGAGWQSPQQSISWRVADGVEEGLYALNFKMRKTLYEGMLSSRKLYINGEVPFKEVDAIGFTYADKWKIVSPEDENGEQFLFRLKGGDVITMETTLGEIGEIIDRAEQCLNATNEIYRRIIMITSSSPDSYRDYKLDELIPETVKELDTQADEIDYIVKSIYSITKRKGSDLATLETLSRQMKKMYNHPDTIAKSISYFKTNLGSFGTWFNTAASTPLELDYISLSAAGSKIKSAEAGFFSDLAYSVQRFIASFTVDYNAVGSTEIIDNSDEAIRVWIMSGRDQFSVLRSLINNSFTADTDIQVSLELVNQGMLLSAVVAGIGPDVVIGQPKTEPVNYALRNAILNLSQFDDLDEVKKRFTDEALVAYYFNDGKSTNLYALPETQDFMVMFYRKDVLADLNLEVPQTWTDVISMITVLNKNNMEFGLPVSSTSSVGATNVAELTMVYNMFLQQFGGTLYADDAMSTQLKTDSATKAFKYWTNFYVNYDLPKSYDFQNRFRTGEMPIGLYGYTIYNTLSVAAPEIRGLWDFTLIPGIKKDDGSIDRSNTLSTLCAFILNDTKDKDKSWKFLKWWTSSDIQSEYGNQIETVLGAGARYNTANTAAFEKLPWSASENNVIHAQLSTCHAIREIAGSYFLQRHISNAFRKVVYKQSDAKDTLYDYANIINSEITKKRSEFKLEIKE